MKLSIIILLSLLFSSEISALRRWNTRCRSGYRFCWRTRRCKPIHKVVRPRPPFICRRACPKGFILTPDCKCVPDQKVCIALACPEGQRRNPKTCQCEPIKKHPPKNCRIKQCLKGYKISSSCTCVRAIPGPYCFVGCKKGEMQVPGTCDCVPYRKCKIKTCRTPAILNKQCKCEMPQDYCDIKCPKGTKFQFPCQCVPIKSCSISKCDHRYRLDPQSCKCKVKPGPICKIGCPPGMRVFPGRCRCVYPPKCSIQACKKGFNLHFDKCKCSKAPIILPPKCNISSCDHRYSLNRKKCRCEVKSGPVCEIYCPPGMRVFPGRCKCVYPPKCAISKIGRAHV